MAQESPKVAISFKEFLEKTPPGSSAAISDICSDWDYATGSLRGIIILPEITLHCDTAGKCGGNREFKSAQSFRVADGITPEFLTYICRNCSETTKTFAVLLHAEQSKKSGSAYKFGELPAFGPPTPARVVSLIGPQKELYFKGRRAESQGMGIAAFAYYRRVIEGQKDRIFDEIIKVCRRLSAGQPVVDELTAAKTETQFSKAVDVVKLAIPQTLFINGQNPLTLLHSALSEGLHAQTDEECLEIATSIRVVMAELAERMGQALKDEAELSTAVSRLLNRKAAAARAATVEAVPAVSAVEVSGQNNG
jgi:hypothetical protein